MDDRYPAALRADIQSGTSAGRVLGGRELVIWRDSAGQAQASEDRCPRRGMKLSFGFARGDHGACLHHGREDDPSGQCRRIPAHPDPEVPPTIRATTHGVAEAGDLIRARPSGDAPSPIAPDATPLRGLHVDAPDAAVLAAPPLLTAGALAVGAEPVDAGRGCGLWIRALDSGRDALHFTLVGDTSPATRAGLAARTVAPRRRIEGRAMILNNYDPDETCSKIRLAASCLGWPLTIHTIDMLPGREHLSEAMLALNPGGSPPVRVNGVLVPTHPLAILMHPGGNHAQVGGARKFDWPGFAFLAVETSEGEAGRIAFDDREPVPVASPAMVWSNTALGELAARRVPVMVSGHDFNPVAVILPLSGHFQQAHRIRVQANASLPFREQTWAIRGPPQDHRAGRGTRTRERTLRTLAAARDSRALRRSRQSRPSLSGKPAAPP